MAIPYSEPSTAHAHPSPPPAPIKWAPYSNAGDYRANMIVLLVILFSALVLILALNAVIRHLLCSFRHRHNHSRRPSDLEKQTQPPTTASLANLIFSANTKLAATEAECSICLGEFVDGDRLSLLTACNHGFHTSCIQKWIESSKSCPTCRTNCNI